MSPPDQPDATRARDRARKARARRKVEAEFKILARQAGHWWKPAVFSLCFLIPALLIIFYVLTRIEALLTSLRVRDAIVQTSSDMIGIIFVAVSLFGIGIVGLLGAMRISWAYLHAGAIFGGVLACLALGVGLMMGGNFVNALLMRHNSYDLCDTKSYYRMTTTLWAAQERGCTGVDYTTWQRSR
ncbi:hypothetical protein FPY71_09575 [Aureimonas fodinaquatilis]|uniref:Uncharacterized protein n=1 Tax=Aureimonas fodinaquatilis TaxID=2565783 RepID=A0A5B0DXI9_9HYPH|nr:hypothetical protein [Aureimonas fodinaquatilis]KAA0970722.1 hypothetical protein FPY71_09575 [Aureimonas fodinaquatilis]